MDLANLRTRAAQFMNRMGGEAAFGPETAARRLRRMDRLGVHTSYRKPLVSAAFQAAREVVGELEAAAAIDLRALPLILANAAAFSTRVTTQPPRPRPPGVPAPAMPRDAYPYEEGAAWRANVDQDAVKPAIEGQLVLAASARHQRRHFQEEWIVSQYFGPNVGNPEQDLVEQICRLSRVVVADHVIPAYDGLAPGAVVHAELGMSASVDLLMVTLCPRVAERLGWRPDPRHVFTYLDEDGQVVAQTLCWRDGGVLSHDQDPAAFRRGFVLVVRKERADDIRPYMTQSQASIAWRMMKKGDDSEMSSHRRVELL